MLSNSFSCLWFIPIDYQIFSIPPNFRIHSYIPSKSHSNNSEKSRQGHPRFPDLQTYLHLYASFPLSFLKHEIASPYITFKHIKIYSSSFIREYNLKLNQDIISHLSKGQRSRNNILDWCCYRKKVL